MWIAREVYVKCWPTYNTNRRKPYAYEELKDKLIKEVLNVSLEQDLFKMLRITMSTSESSSQKRVKDKNYLQDNKDNCYGVHLSQI